MIDKNTLGKLFVISGPSGVGKGTIVSEILQRRKDVVLSISYTSRVPRQNEQHGRDYYFVSRAEFEAMITRKEFLEYAEVHGNYYGTSLKRLNELTMSGKNVLFEVDVQGGLALKKLRPDIVSIFIMAPSHEELKSRIHKRGSETPETLQRRMQTMQSEMKNAEAYDYQVINDVLPVAVTEVLKIMDTTIGKDA
jgi:guanylate kinase